MNWLKIPKSLKNFLFRWRKVLLFFSAIWAIWFYGLGLLSGWFLNKGALDKFPQLSENDRILILSPHIDDEVISSSGIIQEALRLKAKVQIVYLTNGDDNLGSVIKKDKNLKIDPNDFINLGQQRMGEGEKATGILGLNRNDLIFLGYPDRGLYPMLNKNYDQSNPYSSQGTKFTYNPYSGTYESQQLYTGSNVTRDLEEIFKTYQPTIIITPHPRDTNHDHRATYLYLEKILSEQSNHPSVFSYLVHYPHFPSQKKLSLSEFLYPPKRLFTQKGWFSFNLSTNQENNKLNAVNQNVSQSEFRPFYDLLQSFVKRNEIFEKLD